MNKAVFKKVILQSAGVIKNTFVFGIKKISHVLKPGTADSGGFINDNNE